MTHTEQERKIFGPYHNGKESVWADPLSCYRKLVAGCDGDVGRLLKRVRPPGTDPQSEDYSQTSQAVSQLTQVTVTALDLIPFDPKTGEGLLEKEILILLDEFLEFLTKKEPPVEFCPISVQPMESEPLDLGRAM